MRGRILAELSHTRGNRKAAASLLGMSRATFYRRLSDLGIDPPAKGGTGSEPADD